MKKQAGFTLAEMAIVLVIASVLLVMGVKSAQAFLNNTQAKVTDDKLAAVKAALQAYLNANGRLPCPSVPPSGTQIATCNAPNNFGIVPYTDVGLSKIDVSDGWGHPFLYQVNPAATIAGMAIGTDLAASIPASTLTVLEKNAAGATVATNTNIQAVVVSAGANGFGGFTEKSTTLANFRGAAPAGTDELDNTRLAGDPNANRYVSRAYTDNTAATGGAFDDQMVFLTQGQTLMQMQQSAAFQAELDKLTQNYFAILNLTKATCIPPAAFTPAPGTAFGVSLAPYARITNTTLKTAATANAFSLQLGTTKLFTVSKAQFDLQNKFATNCY